MPIRDMLRYAQLRERGSQTTEDRRLILEQHRTNVRARLAELHDCLAVLDTKIAGYSGLNTVEKDNDAATDHQTRHIRETLARPLKG
ncbi:hypothetical protein J2W51_002997 [Tardiphaga robiniae]|jgi:hypothetical protein|nr:hypothetical protein [Tardiphaga robiniae]